MLHVRQHDLRQAGRREAIKTVLWIIATALLAAGMVYAVLHIELITLAKATGK